MMKKGMVALLFTLAALFNTSRAGADVLLLAHGYLGDAFSREAAGITNTLEAHQWRRAGRYSQHRPHGHSPVADPGRTGEKQGLSGATALGGAPRTSSRSFADDVGVVDPASYG